jgi:hypothetical protein
MQIVGLFSLVASFCSGCPGDVSRASHSGGESGGSPEIAGDEHSGVKPAQSFASAAMGGRGCRRFDEPRQCSGRCRRCTRAPGILVIGLLLSVALMGIAANIWRNI